MELLTGNEARLELVRHYGTSSVDAILDPHTKIFQSPHVEGLIGYKQEDRCVVVYGDPIGPDKESLAKQFHEFCKQESLSLIYINLSSAFAKWAQKSLSGVLLEFGHEFYLDPHADPKSHTGNRGSLVRRKVRHAEKEGVEVQEYLVSDPILEGKIEEVGQKWLNGRRGPQVHISNVHIFENRMGKRWFYASCKKEIVGVVVLNRLQNAGGWLLNHLMHVPHAPNGTPELLLTSALQAVANEGCHFVTFGMSPAAKLGEIEGITPIFALFLRSCYSIIYKIFQLAGRGKFWEKFHPESRPSYLVFDKPGFGLVEIKALKKALHVELT